MPGLGVCRANIDTAGGLILVGNPYFFVDGFSVSVEGNPVEDHGNNEHDNAIMVQGVPSFVLGGIPVCTMASQASCGHPPTGSNTFFVG
jgi:uncharacterized Zn-binding protein involved in type VI secretion